MLNKPNCQHIKPNGIRCGSPALRGKDFCYFHDRTRRDFPQRPTPPPAPAAIELPFPEDADSIQYGLARIIQALLAGTINHKTAGLVLYALQTASSNLKNTSWFRNRDEEQTDEQREIFYDIMSKLRPDQYPPKTDEHDHALIPDSQQPAPVPQPAQQPPHAASAEPERDVPNSDVQNSDLHQAPSHPQPQSSPVSTQPLLAIEASADRDPIADIEPTKEFTGTTEEAEEGGPFKPGFGLSGAKSIAEQRFWQMWVHPPLPNISATPPSRPVQHLTPASNYASAAGGNRCPRVTPSRWPWLSLSSCAPVVEAPSS